MAGKAKYGSLTAALLGRVAGGRHNDCWLWTGAVGTHGYGLFTFERRTWLAHRASFQVAVGAIPDGMQVLHVCDTPLCVNPRHLFLGNDADNSADKVSKRRHVFGEHNNLAKLTKSQVRFILQSSFSTAQLARQFGVSREAVGRIRRGNTWVLGRS